MGNVETAPEADAEYELAVDWYLVRNPRAAARFVAAVGRAADLIRKFPDAHPRYDADHRFVTVAKYPFTIFYRSGDPPRIVAVAHNSQRPGYWHGRS